MKFSIYTRLFALTAFFASLTCAPLSAELVFTTDGGNLVIINTAPLTFNVAGAGLPGEPDNNVGVVFRDVWQSAPGGAFIGTVNTMSLSDDSGNYPSGAKRWVFLRDTGDLGPRDLALIFEGPLPAAWNGEWTLGAGVATVSSWDGAVPDFSGSTLEMFLIDGHDLSAHGSGISVSASTTLNADGLLVGPEIFVKPKVDLGQLSLAAKEIILAVSNVGTENALAISGVTASGPDADRITIGEFPATIAPGAAAEINYTLVPDRTGVFQFNINIASDDVDEEDKNTTVAVTAGVINFEGPMAHYALDDAEGSTEMRDITGYGRHGIYDGVTLGQDALATGTAGGFGGGSLGEIPGASLQMTDFTVSMWANPSELADFQTLFGQGSGGSPSFALLFTQAEVSWFVGAEIALSTETSPIAAGTPVHVAATYDSAGPTVTLFVDGVEVARQEGAPEVDLNDSEQDSYYIGAFAGGLPFSGILDDVQVYDRVLPADDIKALFDTPGSVLGEFEGGSPPFVDLPGTLPADSVADFGGPEVDNGWAYGYRNVDLENRTEDYDPLADFIKFPDDWWSGSKWDEPNADGDNVPWTEIAAESTHPNGDNNGELHWTIRRFTSSGGLTDITWSASKANTGCGNGITASVYVNGSRVDSETLSGDDGEGIERTITINLQEGDVVDLVNSPFGDDGTDADGCDGTNMAMTLVPALPLPSYNNNFDGVADGTTDLGDGSIIASNDGTNSIQGGALQMTLAGTSSTTSSFVLPPIDGSGGWTASFDFSIEHSGDNTPADGFSFNYGLIPEGENYGGAEEGYGAATPHISYQVDTWGGVADAFSQDAGVGIELTGDELALTKTTDDNANFKPNEKVEASTTMSWDPINGASFSTTGLRTNAAFSNLATDGFTPDVSYGFSFLARTGGFSETVIIDNLVITTGTPPPGVPEIQGISKTAAGISLLLPEGTTYDIEYSTDLQNWSNVATDVTRSYDDTDAGRTGNPAGFYRGVVK